MNSITDCSAADFSLTDTNGEEYSPESDVNGGESSTVTSDYTYTIADNEVTVTKYNGKNIYVTIPDTIEGYPVTKLGDKAFYQNTAIKTVTFGSNIRTLGSYVFYGCTSLREVCANDVLENYGSSTFYNCTSLRKINIPKGITSMPSLSGCSNVTVVMNDGFTEVPDKFFYNVSRISSVILPESITSIGNSAFCGCSGLTSITIPSGVTTIGTSAFSDCSELKSITIPTGVTTIESYTFYGCTGLTSITLPSGVTNIGKYAFNNCTKLETINIPKNAAFNSSGYTFNNCSKLKNVIFDSEIEKIPDYLFYNCSNLDSLTSITIPDTVTEIGKYAFYGCTGLTSISVPCNVTSIGAYAFDSCTSLETINIPKNATFSSSGGTFSNCTNLKNVTFDSGIEKIPDSLFYKCGNLDSLTSITIPNTVTSIGSYAFYGCTGLTSISVSCNVTSIGSYAFSGCTSLETINIPKNATFNSSGGTFSKCTNLKNVTFDSGIEKIPDYIFSGSTLYSRTSITIPDTVTEIGNGAFSNCFGVTSISIPNSVTIIGSGAFNRCSSLETINIPKNAVFNSYGGTFRSCTNLKTVTFDSEAEKIPDYLFYEGSYKNELTSLISITIPDTVTEIGKRAFWGCENLESINIPKNTLLNSSGATFYNCKNLKTVIFADGIEKIPDYLFYESSNLYSLTSITIPNTVTEVGKYAFYDCTSLESIIIPKNTVFNSSGCTFRNCRKLKTVTFANGIEKIPDYLFSGSINLDSLTSITIPDSVTEIGTRAFGGCSGLTSISLPSGLKRIETGALASCSGLKSIALPSSLESIGYYAFDYCTNLETINIPKNVKFDYNSYSNGGYFDNCKSLKSVIFDIGIEKIPDYLFYQSDNLDSLTSITIPDTVTEIGKYAFSSCTSLETINIPKNAVFNSSGGTFRDCKNLKTVTFASGTEKIPDYLFYACYYLDSLTSITIPNTVTEIGKYAFTSCSNLETINIPKNVVFSSTGGTFNSCENLKTVTFDSGIEKIPDYLFYLNNNLDSLTSITIPNTVTEIGKYAFSNCKALTSITIPSSVISIGSSAFSSCTNLTIYGITGSYAETYAANNNIPFVSIGGEHIASQPKSITVIEGLDASFSVSAVGSGYTYQWQKYSASGWVNLIGKTSSTLYLNDVTYDMNGSQYRCIVSSGSNSETSESAVLTVKPAEQVTEAEVAKMSIAEVIKFVNAFTYRYGVSGQKNDILTSAQIKAIEIVLENDYSKVSA